MTDHDPRYVASLATQLRDHRPDALDAAEDDLPALTAELAIDHITRPEPSQETSRG
jgi:hypothetical protein